MVPHRGLARLRRMRVSLSADRISGLVFLLAGLAMIFAVIPAEVEAVEGGNIAPSTLPIVMSAIMAFGGGVLLVRPHTPPVSPPVSPPEPPPVSPSVSPPESPPAPARQETVQQHLPPWRQLLRRLGIVLLLVVALAAMSQFGFMLVAPALALALMWLSGERRWRWYAIGAGLVPAAIWVFVVQILGRQLI